MSRNALCCNGELHKGDYLLSNNKQYKAVFEEDGNFVVYGWKPIWSSNTAKHSDAERIVMQGDANFVMYTSSDKPVWHTNSHKDAGPHCTVRLMLQDDGDLVVRSKYDTYWSSKNE
ncbi:B-type lectin plumieribetin-like [Engraulis encrasicolus]|uniref:B-type lectin plumieribetin-like n=1 Tax=Engraulis encrasicolus TaxID=184585 RepID=UPI002FD4628F